MIGDDHARALAAMGLSRDLLLHRRPQQPQKAGEALGKRVNSPAANSQGSTGELRLCKDRHDLTKACNIARSRVRVLKGGRRREVTPGFSAEVAADSASPPSPGQPGREIDVKARSGTPLDKGLISLENSSLILKPLTFLICAKRYTVLRSHVREALMKINATPEAIEGQGLIGDILPFAFIFSIPRIPLG